MKPIRIGWFDAQEDRSDGDFLGFSVCNSRSLCPSHSTSDYQVFTSGLCCICWLAFAYYRDNGLVMIAGCWTCLRSTMPLRMKRNPISSTQVSTSSDSHGSYSADTRKECSMPVLPSALSVNWSLYQYMRHENTARQTIATLNNLLRCSLEKGRYDLTQFLTCR